MVQIAAENCGAHQMFIYNNKSWEMAFWFKISLRVYQVLKNHDNPDHTKQIIYLWQTDAHLPNACLFKKEKILTIISSENFSKGLLARSRHLLSFLPNFPPLFLGKNSVKLSDKRGRQWASIKAGSLLFSRFRGGEAFLVFGIKDVDNRGLLLDGSPEKMNRINYKSRWNWKHLGVFNKRTRVHSNAWFGY